MARGMPSSSRQIRATSPVTVKPGCTALARSANRRIAGAVRGSPPGAGRPSGDRGNSVSPAMARGSRLVARTVTPRAVARRCSVRRAASSMTCSQLSRTSSIGWPVSMEPRRSRGSAGSRPAPNRPASPTVAPTAATTAGTTRAGSATDPSSTRRADSGHREATSMDRRVLPVPPNPVIVTSRDRRRAAVTPSSSASRPTKLVGRAGTPPRRGVPSRSAARCAARSSGPGSTPRRSASSPRTRSYASSASARRSAAHRTRISRACSRSRRGCSRASSSTSATATGVPRARSAAIRSSTMASRVSSIRATGATAKPAVPASASGTPRQRSSPSRSRAAARWGSLASSAVCPSRAARSNAWTSTSSGATSSRYPAGWEAMTCRSSPKVRRSRATRVCRAPEGSAGRSPPQRSSASRSAVTTRPASIASRTSNSRSRTPPTSTARPSAPRTRKGPSIATRITR